MRARVWAVAAILGLASAAHADLSDDLQELVDEYDGFLNDKTPVGVSDGNPQSATAYLADVSYRHYGLFPRTDSGVKDETNSWTFDLNAGGGTLDSGKIDGYYGTLEGELATRFSDQVALSLILPFEYRNIQGTDTYVGGALLGLPITLIPDNGVEGFSWTLTPSLTAASISASVQLAQGGWFFGGGLSSTLSWRTGPLTLTMANQATYDWGEPFEYKSTINLGQDISQVVLKNGFGAAYALGNGWSVDGGITYTNMLNEAYTDSFWTPTVGVTLGLGPGAGIRAGFEGDFADNYTAVGGEVQFFVRF